MAQRLTTPPQYLEACAFFASLGENAVNILMALQVMY
jgi:hypothetical protein